MDATDLVGAGAKRDVSTGISASKRAAPYDRNGHRPSYLADERLSLQAKGVLTIITNYSYEQIVQLEHSADREFSSSLEELRRCGYVGRFDADIFEVRLSPSPCAPGGFHGQK